MIVENVCKVFYIKKVNSISGVLHISLIFLYFCTIKERKRYGRDSKLYPCLEKPFSDFYSLIKCSIIKLEDYKCLVFSPNIPLE